ncbi:TonB-dependent receptor [Parabacteroides merdae]|uniref:SusC/RagA family TonB-linked outer membrane protein n=1 Tax=Parabacteroides merdae TaxID=46503 RepID=A0A3R6E8F5_9BACT|nr:TonB-dependent receptor [Parabacteroides merdae]RHH76747.1 SusC/RagA family TonB-linked outer membrane protein [Parabacteroides merdae]
MKKLFLSESLPKKDSGRKQICRVMKLTASFLLLCSCFAFAGHANSQNAKVSLNKKHARLEEVLDEIERQTDYLFISNRHVDLKQKVSVDVNEESVNDVLKKVLKNTDLTYNIEGINIILRRRSEKHSLQVIQQVHKITGTVVDKAGLPVIGANVIVKGTTNGTVTDVEGRFSLEIPENAVLLVSYIGYVEREMQVGDESALSIILQEDTQALEEVVVVGYGTQKKINLTGAVESISSDVIEDRPIKSVADALQGTALGVTVTSAAGQPGEFSKIKIRGDASLNSDGALVLIDGMPGDLNQVNPQDIENISVLKDAASSAIYGARAAEGVILVTTKSGKSTKTRVEYSGNISFNTPTRIPESTTAAEHARLSNLAFTNAGLAPNFTEEAINAINNHSTVSIPKGNDWIYTADMDWIDLMMDRSFQQQHNLTVSRSQESLKYLFSAGWLDQDGMFSEYGPDNFDRFNLRSNVNLDIVKDKLNLDSRITFSRMDQRYHPKFGEWTIPYITFIQAGPNMPIYDTNGNYARYRMQANPIQALREGGEGKEFTNVVDGIFTLSYKPITDLTLKAVGGARFTSKEISEWRRAYGKYGPNGLVSMAAGQSGDNNLTLTKDNTRYFTGQLLAEYSKSLGSHDFKLLGGWSAEMEYYSMLSGKRLNIVGNELPALDLGATDGWSNDGDETHWALLSGFMRLNYAYASKYLFEANFRADGSSRFSSRNKWGIFPSFSIGWRITEEDFMKEQNLFSNLKLRASWGQLGNQNGLGLYDHIAQYVVDGYYPFKNELAQWAKLSQLPSETRSWETVEMKNIALEMGFLDNRLTVTGEYFHKRNKDMLVNIEVPSVIGIDVPTGNYGELVVKGWEVSIGWRDQIKDFNYFVSFNLADRKDKLVDYGVEYTGFTAGVDQKVQGYSIGSIFGFETDGYFQTSKEAQEAPAFNRAIQDAGDIRYIDQDGDGKISAPNDLVYLGTTQPRYEFSFHLGGSWKSIDFSALFQGVGKRNFYLDGEVFQPFRDSWSNYSYTYFSDYWTPENPNALLPRLYAGTKHNYQYSSHWLQNAAYIRLKNLQVGYTLNPEWTRKVKIEKLRVYFNGENMFEFSKMFRYFDPELNKVAGYMYPIMRNYSLGVNVVF